MNPDLTYLYNIVKSASKELIKINTLITHKPKNKTRKKNFFKKNFFKKVRKNKTQKRTFSKKFSKTRKRQ